MVACHVAFDANQKLGKEYTSLKCMVFVRENDIGSPTLAVKYASKNITLLISCRHIFAGQIHAEHNSAREQCQLRLCLALAPRTMPS
jgi:hypothetical protein